MMLTAPEILDASILVVDDQEARPAWPSSDTRLKPHEPVTSKYIFAKPANGYAVITVKLIYRYAFIDIARQKGWGMNDIIVTEEALKYISVHHNDRVLPQ